MELTDSNVESVVKDCLYDDDEVRNLKSGELPQGMVVVESLTATKFGFNPERLNKRKDDIKSMLSQLPDEFMQGKGDGWSFLNACTRKDGTQWTGSHRIVDILFVLGQAIGCAKITLDRSLWMLLPGGVPYFIVNINGLDN